MPLSITASRTSSTSSSPYRVSKPKRPSFLASRKKVSSSTSTSTSTSVSASASASITNRQQRQGNNRSHPSTSGVLLPDHGPASCVPANIIITKKATSIPSNTVVDMMTYITTTHMFDPIPARRSGMNSTRIAEVLNFRRTLPPIVTKGHVLALSSAFDIGNREDGLNSRSYTSVEREIAGLVAKGVLRKVVIPGLVAGSGSGRRGLGDRFRLGGGNGGGSGGVEMAAAGGEGLVLVKEWERMVDECKQLSEDVKKKYLSALHASPTSPTITFSSSSASLDSATTLTVADTFSLIQAGFLTSSSSSSPASASASTPNSSSVPTSAKNRTTTNSYTFSLPNTGPYLYLLRTAKEHLRSLVIKTSSSSPSAPKAKIREVARSILKMRWDGTGVGSAEGETEESSILVAPAGGTFTAEANPSKSVTSDPSSGSGFVGPVSSSSSSPVHASSIINPRIRKWKQFRGLAFDWVLCECVGSGAMECFETGTVGVGVRLC